MLLFIMGYSYIYTLSPQRLNVLPTHLPNLYMALQYACVSTSCFKIESIVFHIYACISVIHKIFSDSICLPHILYIRYITLFFSGNILGENKIIALHVTLTSNLAFETGLFHASLGYLIRGVSSGKVWGVCHSFKRLVG